MAEKLLLQIEKDMQETSSPRSSIGSNRRNSKFLSGTSIPNSTIRRSSLDSSNKTENIEEEIACYPTRAVNVSIPDEAERKKRLSEERGMERMRRKIRSLSVNTEERLKTREERHASTIATLQVIPQSKVRRSTLESIRTAIEKSPNHTIRLVNADSIERRNVGQHFKILNLEPTFSRSPQKIKEPTPNKRDLQTQTSLPLDKLFK